MSDTDEYQRLLAILSRHLRRRSWWPFGLPRWGLVLSPPGVPGDQDA